MIDSGWDEYRGWAKRSRALQKDLSWANTAALACAALAAALGALAAALGENGGKPLAALAAVAAAATPIVGRHILESGSQAGWIRARATAEAIKGECYRAAARLPPYDGPDARNRFYAMLDALSADATKVGLTLLQDPVGHANDERRPPEQMDVGWYREHRIRGSRLWFAARQDENERKVVDLRRATFALALLGAALGALAKTLQVTIFAPWIAVVSTIGGLLVAYGAMERRQFLAASYGAMAVALGRLEQCIYATDTDLATLVEQGERLLEGEHRAWADRLTRLMAPPPSPQSQRGE